MNDEIERLHDHQEFNRAMLEARLEVIKDLVEASNCYGVDRSYSMHHFYVVEKPDVEKAVAELQAQLKELGDE